jgi:hypothetical protein
LEHECYYGVYIPHGMIPWIWVDISSSEIESTFIVFNGWGMGDSLSLNSLNSGGVDWVTLRDLGSWSMLSGSFSYNKMPGLLLILRIVIEDLSPSEEISFIFLVLVLDILFDIFSIWEMSYLLLGWISSYDGYPRESIDEVEIYSLHQL